MGWGSLGLGKRQMLTADEKHWLFVGCPHHWDLQKDIILYFMKQSYKHVEMLTNNKHINYLTY